MLRLPPFDYLSPHSLDEAVELFAQHAPDAMYVAGGTDLYPNMKRRQFEPKFLIGLSGIRELRGMEYGRGYPAPMIRAGTTLSQLANEPIAQSKYSALANAAALVSTPQLRAMGTIGGNLLLDTRCNYYNQNYWWRKAINFCMKKDGEICWVAPGSSRCWAVSSSDCAPVMIALDAQLRLVGPKGERVIAANDLYRDDGINYLSKAPDEILTEIILPPSDHLKSFYLKLRRRGAFDFPILGVAVALRFALNGEVQDARIVLGGVGSRPLVANDSAKILMGNKLDEDVINAAAEAAWKPARPLDNTDMSHSYRKKMSRVYVTRALNALKS
jgi:4-hydroxybenzoyl-CoA reductase subunit beta